MEQTQINYRDIMDLGFTEEEQSDSTFFDTYGYPWSIITLNIAKRIYIDWDKTTRTCELIRIDKDHYIKGRIKIRDLDHLKQIIHFFKD